MSGGRIRSLVSDTMIYGVFTIVGRFLTFLLTPIYSNYLTKSEVGEISNIFAIVAFVNIIYSFGMETAFLRYWKSEDSNQNDDSKLRRIKVFSQAWLTIFLVSFVSTIVIILSGVFYSSQVINLANSYELLVYAALLPFLDCMLIVPMAMLRMTRQAKRFAWSRFLMIISAVFLNILFITVFNLGVEGVFYAQIISSIFGISLMYPFIKEYLQIKFDRQLLSNMLRFGVPTIPAAFSGMILQVINIPLIKFLTNSETAALYAVNNRLAIPMMLFVSVFEYAWKPFYLNRHEDKDSNSLFGRVFTYFTIASSILFLAVTYFIEFIVAVPFVGGKFINPAYWSGMGIVPLVMLGFYFNGSYNNFASSLHIEKKTNYLPISVGVAAILNIILNVLLVPSMLIMGSALASAISYYVSSGMILFFSRKFRAVEYDWLKVGSIILMTAGFWYLGDSAGKLITDGMLFVVRLAMLCIFIVLLFLFKVLTNSEINSMKLLFVRNSKTIDDNNQLD